MEYLVALLEKWCENYEKSPHYEHMFFWLKLKSEFRQFKLTKYISYIPSLHNVRWVSESSEKSERASTTDQTSKHSKLNTFRPVLHLNPEKDVGLVQRGPVKKPWRTVQLVHIVHDSESRPLSILPSRLVAMCWLSNWAKLALPPANFANSSPRGAGQLFWRIKPKLRIWTIWAVVAVAQGNLKVKTLGCQVRAPIPSLPSANAG